MHTRENEQNRTHIRPHTRTPHSAHGTARPRAHTQGRADTDTASARGDAGAQAREHAVAPARRRTGAQAHRLAGIQAHAHARTRMRPSTHAQTHTLTQTQAGASTHMPVAPRKFVKAAPLMFGLRAQSRIGGPHAINRSSDRSGILLGHLRAIGTDANSILLDFRSETILQSRPKCEQPLVGQSRITVGPFALRRHRCDQPLSDTRSDTIS